MYSILNGKSISLSCIIKRYHLKIIGFSVDLAEN